MPTQLWQGKLNINREPKLALIFNEVDDAMQKTIRSFIISPVVDLDLAEIYWQIGDRQTINKETVICSSTKQLLSGLAQLYTLGVTINWKAIASTIPGKKIPLPTYPFQRSTYWFE